MTGWLLALIAIVYVGGLFLVAWYGDYHGESLRKRWQPLIYSLSLAVYCTSWTFFGAVGQASHDLWSFLPIYLGPILVFVLFWKLLVKMIQVSKAENITSIADFIASRHGRSPFLAILVTLILVVGVLPYIALQLKAIVMGFDQLTDGRWGGLAWSRQDMALAVTFTMAIFVIMFGTRRLDTTEHQDGVMTAIAFESLIKLLVFILVGVWVTWVSWERGIYVETWNVMAGEYSGNWLDSLVIPTVMAMAAILCLPRQFHVTVVENASIEDFHKARWLFPLYLVLVALFVLPLAIAGQTLLGESISSDAYVIALPKALGNYPLAVIAYLGGVSAAISMVIVATIALSNMISNEILMPLMLRQSRRHGQDFYRFSGLLLNVRRTTIVCLLMMAYVVYRMLDHSGSLAGIGQISFAAVAQLAPVLVGSLYFSESNSRAVMMGLLTGTLVWFFCLMVPVLAASGWVDEEVLLTGLFGLAWLKPEDLFMLGLTDSVTGTAFLALSLNILMYLLGCLYFQPDWEEKKQARTFVDAYLVEEQGYENINISVMDLRELAERFVGKGRVEAMMQRFGQEKGRPALDLWFRQQRAGPDLLSATERLLAGTMGASSARIVMKSLMAGRVALEDVQAMADEASEVFHFNRELLQGAIEHISQGISVIDRKLQLVAWNRQYLQLFNYPDELIRAGRPIADVIRHNARQGLCGQGDVEEHVRKRLSYMQQGAPHKSERCRSDGRVIQMQGNPMPGGGFVMSFMDITEFRQVESALKEANESLELRVQERTLALSELNQQLLKAKSQAERVNELRTRFFTAVSHDLMQPMNAARLFAASLELEAKGTEVETLARHVSSSLKSAENLIKDLLDMSRLESGKLTAMTRELPLNDILKPLITEFSLIARKEGVVFRGRETAAWVKTDPVFLRRVLQNFLTNSFRYSSAFPGTGFEEGHVLIGCRYVDEAWLKIEVRDNGPGIPEDKQQLIFSQFQRLASDSKGLGLGLSIAKGMADSLGTRIDLVSAPAKGAVFSILVPVASRRVKKQLMLRPEEKDKSLELSILCIDDEPEILQGMRSLLSRWGCDVKTANAINQSFVEISKQKPDLLLVDFQLGARMTGVELIQAIRERLGDEVPAVLVTADKQPELRQQCLERGITFLGKPVKPAAMRAVLNRYQARIHGAPKAPASNQQC